MHLTELQLKSLLSKRTEFGLLWIDIQETEYLRQLHNRVNQELGQRFEDAQADCDGPTYHFHMTVTMGEQPIIVMMSGGLGLEELSVDAQRAVMEASADMFPAESDVLASEIDAGGVPADWITVDASEADRVVLYFHGGGYVMRSRNTHRGLAGRIARAARTRVLLPDDRLAPEHPFPAAVEDATTCWLGWSQKVMIQTTWPSSATPRVGGWRWRRC